MDRDACEAKAKDTLQWLFYEQVVRTIVQPQTARVEK